MSDKVLRDDFTRVIMVGVAGLVALILMYQCARWVEKAEATKKEAEQQLASAQAEQRSQFNTAVARDVQLNQPPIWSGELSPAQLTPWITLPSGYSWTFAASDDVRVLYLTPTGESGSEAFLKTTGGKQLVLTIEKLRFENIGRSTQQLKVWVYQVGVNGKSITLPTGETLRWGAPVAPSVEGRPAGRAAATSVGRN